MRFRKYVELARGEKKTVRFYFVNESGVAVDLTGYSKVSVAIAAGTTEATKYVEKNSTGSPTEFSIVALNGYVDVLFTDVETEALPAEEELVGDVWIEFSSGDKVASERFEVRVREGVVV